MVLENSLNSRTLLSLMLPLVLYAIVTALVQNSIIFPSFVTLEREEAEKNVERCVSAINNEIGHLKSLCTDWAYWDPAYRFMENYDEDFVADNLVDDIFQDINLNFIYFCDTEGRVVWGRSIDHGTGKSIPVADFNYTVFPEDHPLLTTEQPGEDPESRGKSGVFMTDAGALIVSAEPILTSLDRGPSRGTLIFGRLLNEHNLSSLNRQTKVPFSIIPIAEISGDRSLSGRRLRQIYRGLESGGEIEIDMRSNTHLKFYTLFRDLNGGPAFLITARMPMRIIDRGKKSLLSAWVSVIFAWLFITLFALMLITRLVLRPLNTLTRHILTLGKTGDLSTPLILHRDDEIGLLINEFNRLIERIDEGNSSLEKANGELSRLNAQKDLLFSILSHDLRTPFSSISTCVYMLKDALAEGDLSESGEITATIEGNLRQGENLLGNLLEWVRIHREGAGFAPEKLNARELTEAAAAVLGDKADLKEIRIENLIPEDLFCLGEYTALCTVLRNLFSNSIKFTPRGGRIILSAEAGGGECRIHVADNGIGMEEDFIAAMKAGRKKQSTTGTEGEIGTGIGLILAKELIEKNGGRLNITSTPGGGSVFSMILPGLPVSPPEENSHEHTLPQLAGPDNRR